MAATGGSVAAAGAAGRSASTTRGAPPAHVPDAASGRPPRAAPLANLVATSGAPASVTAGRLGGPEACAASAGRPWTTVPPVAPAAPTSRRAEFRPCGRTPRAGNATLGAVRATSAPIAAPGLPARRGASRAPTAPGPARRSNGGCRPRRHDTPWSTPSPATSTARSRATPRSRAVWRSPGFVPTTWRSSSTPRSWRTTPHGRDLRWGCLRGPRADCAPPAVGLREPRGSRNSKPAPSHPKGPRLRGSSG